MKPSAPVRAAVALSAALVLACSSVEPIDPALARAVDDVMIPSIEGFAAEARAFEADAEIFCVEPSAQGLTELQDAWLDLSRSWNAASPYFMGPLDDDPIVPAMYFLESQRQRGMYFVNPVRDQLRSAVDGSDPIDEDFIEGLTFNRVGLLALEVLLFEDAPRSESNASADILEGYEMLPRKCAYLAAVAGQVARRSASVRDGFSVEYAPVGESYRNALVSGEPVDGIEPVTILFVAVTRHVEYLRQRKLDAIPDARLAGLARPAESPFYANLAVAVAELEALLGVGVPEDAPTFLSVMESRGSDDVAQALRDALAASRTAVEDEAQGRSIEAFILLEETLRQRADVALGVEFGLNFSDGD